MKIRKTAVRNYVIALMLLVIYLLPIYILINLSVRSQQDFSSKLIFPDVLQLGNYISVLKSGDLWRGFKNSMILTLETVTLEIFVSALGAYGLARSKSRLAGWVRRFSMAVMMVPAVALLVGTYSLMVKFHMSNTLWGLSLLLAAGGLPASMFMYINFVKTIPMALDEAATIDGASTWKTFFMIIMPQLKAITVTRVIIAATACWNQYLMPMYLLQDKSKHTVILVIKAAFNQYNGVGNLPKACATCALGLLPIIVLYLFLQRYIIEGQLDSSVK